MWVGVNCLWLDLQICSFKLNLNTKSWKFQKVYFGGLMVENLSHQVSPFTVYQCCNTSVEYHKLWIIHYKQSKSMVKYCVITYYYITNCCHHLHCFLIKYKRKTTNYWENKQKKHGKQFKNNSYSKISKNSKHNLKTKDVGLNF